MEYVKVTFPTRRRVYIDDEANGFTNQVLRVDAGTHRFDLGDGDNYRPRSRKVTVKDTSPQKPKRVAFRRKSK
jgi:hypothetical protein